ncbi:MAG TPA: hypothetical protein VN579_04400, partial [Bryobacteraceae bacterium]|nr:hypothetical protein [Bryobacteraceae bacterium]
MEPPRNRPRSQFEQPEPPSPDQPSSATGVFGQVQAAPRAEEDLLASLLRQGAPEKKVEDAEPPKPPVVASPAQPAFPPAAVTANETTPAGGPEASRSPGEFTRMLQALTTP